MDETRIEKMAEETFESKASKVRNHIRTIGFITSWDAITLYGATRLSAVIYDAKTDNGGSMNIGTYSSYKTRVDSSGKKHTSRFAVYYDADQYSEEEIHRISNL